MVISLGRSIHFGYDSCWRRERSSRKIEETEAYQECSDDYGPLRSYYTNRSRRPLNSYQRGYREDKGDRRRRRYYDRHRRRIASDCFSGFDPPFFYSLFYAPGFRFGGPTIFGIFSLEKL